MRRTSSTLRALAILSTLLLRDVHSADPSGELKRLRDAGVQHYQERRYFQAIEAMQAALRIAGDSERPEVATLLARFQSALGVELFNSGESQKADEVFRQALGTAEDSFARFGLGLLHFVRGEDQEALEHLEKAAALDGTYGKTQKLLGMLEYRRGRTQEATARMEAALRLDPKDAEARSLLDRWRLERGFTGAFTEREERGFLLRVDPLLPKETVDVAAQRLAAARRDISEALGSSSKRRWIVVLFAESRFHEATGSRHWIGAVYDGQVKLPLPAGALDDGARRDLEAAVRHEIAHAVIREVSPECPNWLNEGLAQHFEGTVDRGRLQKELRESKMRRIPFREVPARLWEVDDERIARWTYLEGLGFVEHLAARHHEFRLRLCLEALARERSLARAFEVTYGSKLDDLERRFWEEVDRP